VLSEVWRVLMDGGGLVVVDDQQGGAVLGPDAAPGGPCSCGAAAPCWPPPSLPPGGAPDPGSPRHWVLPLVQATMFVATLAATRSLEAASGCHLQCPAAADECCTTSKDD
jgi:hypothetical protein